MRTIITTILTLGLSLLTLPAHAQEMREPSRGRGKLVSGILLTSIGGAVGSLVVLFGGYGECHDSLDECDKQQAESRKFGLAIIGVGVGAGIPLIVMGAEERREWKEWKKQQIQEGEDRNASTSLDFRFSPVPRGGAAVLTFNY